MKTQLVSLDQSNNNGSINVKMDGSILKEKQSFKMLGLTFSSKLYWGSYIISFAKTASTGVENMAGSSSKFDGGCLSQYMGWSMGGLKCQKYL